MSTPSPLATLSQAALILVGRKNTTYSRLLGTAPLLRLTLQQQKYILSTYYNAMLQKLAVMEAGAMMQTLMLSLRQRYRAMTAVLNNLAVGSMCEAEAEAKAIATEPA